MPTFVAKITSKGQITLPAELRRTLGVDSGDIVEFVSGPQGRVFVRPRNVNAADVLTVLEPRAPLPEIKSDDDAVELELAARDRRSRRKKEPAS